MPGFNPHDPLWDMFISALPPPGSQTSSRESRRQAPRGGFMPEPAPASHPFHRGSVPQSWHENPGLPWPLDAELRPWLHWIPQPPAVRRHAGAPSQTAHQAPQQPQQSQQQPRREAEGTQQTSQQEKASSPDTLRADTPTSSTSPGPSSTPNVPNPEEAVPNENEGETRGTCHGSTRCGGRQRSGGFPKPALEDFVAGLQQAIHTGLSQAASSSPSPSSPSGGEYQDFNPQVDLFNTPAAYVLHLALPGAKRDDIGVDWDADAGLLKVAGVVHRPGDEEFISHLVRGERRVGAFERKITLPPRGAEKEQEVDGLAITAKMEDGVLVVTVPKADKDWTQIHKVDIE